MDIDVIDGELQEIKVSIRPCLYDPGIPGFHPVARDVFHPGFIWSGDRDVSFIQKKRGKVDNNLLIKRKLILFA